MPVIIKLKTITFMPLTMMSMRHKKTNGNEDLKDLGFGTANQINRMINPEGSFNVKRTGLPFFESLNFYHSLITMSWPRFNILIFFLYITVNIFFACLYVFFGTEKLAGATGVTLQDQFFDAFFFSAQTFTTVGYGRISPLGWAPSIIAAIESLAGLLGFALATGLLYGRFSRPVAKIIYSKQALIAPYKGITAFQFKIANALKHELIEVEAQIALSAKKTINSQVIRTFENLELERSKITFMPSTWTVVHPIDETSRLFDLAKEDLEEMDAEFIIILKGFDDTFSQHVYSRSSYKYNEIVWGAKYLNNFNKVENGINIVELDKLNDFEKAELPVLKIESIQEENTIANL
jgi:inward rectifier potassium channel